MKDEVIEPPGADGLPILGGPAFALPFISRNQSGPKEFGRI